MQAQHKAHRLEPKRRSPIVEISLLLAECVQHGLRTIAFCKTRKVCELVTYYTREILKETAPDLVPRIAVYRHAFVVYGVWCTGTMLSGLVRMLHISPWRCRCSKCRNSFLTIKLQIR
jgi:hypothetical protein